MQIQILFFLFVSIVSFVYLRSNFDVIGSPITCEAKHLFALQRVGLIDSRVLAQVRQLLPARWYMVVIVFGVGVVGWRLLFWSLEFFHSIESLVGFFLFGFVWEFFLQTFFKSVNVWIEQLALAAYFSRGSGILAEPIRIEESRCVEVTLYLKGPMLRERLDQSVSVLGKEIIIPGLRDEFGMSLTVPLDILRKLESAFTGAPRHIFASN